ncbi:hypothetical protein HanIR_Chr02g0059381 [Helianthus annuus]|nr:hypothetical protein HanIR_Chr02g0059381 [Helianthus annuus]
MFLITQIVFFLLFYRLTKNRSIHVELSSYGLHRTLLRSLRSSFSMHPPGSLRTVFSSLRTSPFQVSISSPHRSLRTMFSSHGTSATVSKLNTLQ